MEAAVITSNILHQSSVLICMKTTWFYYGKPIYDQECHFDCTCGTTLRRPRETGRVSSLTGMSLTASADCWGSTSPAPSILSSASVINTGCQCVNDSCSFKQLLYHCKTAMWNTNPPFLLTAANVQLRYLSINASIYLISYNWKMQGVKLVVPSCGISVISQQPGN